MSTMGDPARNGAAITPSDTADIGPCRGFPVGGAGDVSVIFEGGDSAVLLAGCLAGAFYPYRVSRIRASGTTATSIVALF